MSTPAPFVPNQSSRSLDALILPAKLKALEFIHACRMDGIDLLVTCTYRCAVDQNNLYAQGRTTPGRIVTNARAGESMHQYRVALDIVPLRHGKPVWGLKGNGIDNDPSDDDTDDLELWQRVGLHGEAAGLEWAGRWPHFREYPHFQYTGGLKLADFKAGKLPA
jgi:peptidoglycan L-alanyl-D-glutamate endopeptidase CwlK